MIEQKLKTYYAQFQKLSPRAEFLFRSKVQITAATQGLPVRPSFKQRFIESITAGGALALASLFLVIIIGGISYISREAGSGAVATTATDPDSAALLREASQLTSSVHIGEVDRFSESAEQVVSALDQLSKETVTK
jgi:hypothetical protein